jgi:hypothetical protein
MRYRVVFEYQSEDSSMSDVYNCKDEQSAMDKFAELCDMLEHSIDPTDPTGWEVVDELDNYSIINREEGIFGYVRLLEG